MISGSQSQDGPVVVCGDPHGYCHILDLPTLEERIQFKYHDRDVRAVHNIGGAPSFFATGSMDGEYSIN